MQAIRVHQFGGPEVLKLDENVPIPQPAAGEVLIRVHAVGVNPVETYIRAGAFPNPPALPYVPGDDAAGVVSAVGEGVVGFKAGDRVFTGKAAGAYAQYTLAPVESVQHLPDVLSFEQGASIPLPYLTAYRALFHKGEAVPGQTVLINGATGGVGIAAIHLARARGLNVIATGGTEEGRKLLKEQGVEHVLNHREENYHKKVKEITNGRGVELILENVASANLANDHDVLIDLGGKIICIGSRGEARFNPVVTFLKEVKIIGILIYAATPAETKESYAGIQVAIQSGLLRPIVGKRFPLAEASAAHTDIINGKGALGKSVLIVE